MKEEELKNLEIKRLSKELKIQFIGIPMTKAEELELEYGIEFIGAD